MAHLLGADGISLTVGTRTLLDDVSLGLDDGDRVGIVGPNGAGKTTLLRLLAGTQQPDGGRVTRVGGLRVGLLDQRDDVGTGATIRDLVHGDAATHAWASDASVRTVHAVLLQPDSDWDEYYGPLTERVAEAQIYITQLGCSWLAVFSTEPS